MSEDSCGLKLLKETITSSVLEEVTLTEQFSDYINVSPCFEFLDVFNDVGMVALGENPDLSFEHFSLLCR